MIKINTQIMRVFFMLLLVIILISSYVLASPLGDGSDGSYVCSSGTCNLELNKVYQFTNFTIDSGATVSTLNDTGAVLYILVQDTATIDGTINLSSKVIPGNNSWCLEYSTSQTICSPGTAVGGDGGEGGTVNYAGAGGSSVNGFGGGGGGGSARQNTAGVGGDGDYPAGTGGSSVSGTVGDGGSNIDYLEGNSGVNSSGGSGSLVVYSYSILTSTSGAGGNAYSSNGGSYSGWSCTGSTAWCWSGGGGGAGGIAGRAGVNLFINAKSLNITSNSVIDLSGTDGGDGGDGGQGYFSDSTGTGLGVNGGGGGGGAGGNSGSAYLYYYYFNTNSGSTILNKGNGGLGGVHPSAVNYNSVNGTAGSDGVDGTSINQATIFIESDVTPSIAYNTSDLVLSTICEGNSSSYTLYYNVYVDDVLNVSGNSSVLNDVSTNVITIANAETSVNQNWTFETWCSNSTLNSSKLNISKHIYSSHIISFNLSNLSAGDTVVGSCHVNSSINNYWLNTSAITVKGDYGDSSSIYQDGVVNNRTYEDDTSLNLTVGCYADLSNFTVYSSLDGGQSYFGDCNGTVANVSTLINVTGVYDDNSYSLNNTNNITLVYSSWYNISGNQVVITSSDTQNISDISFYVDGVLSKVLYGRYEYNLLFQNNFSTGSNSTGLFFTDTILEQSFYVDVSTNPFVNLSFIMTSFEADPDPLSFNETFVNDSNIDSSQSNSSYPYFTIDDLESNLGYWSGYGTLDTNEYQADNDRYYLGTSNNAVGTGAQDYTVTDDSEGYVFNNQVDLNNLYSFGVNFYCSISFGAGDGNNFYSNGEADTDCYVQIAEDSSDTSNVVTLYQIRGTSSNGYCWYYVNGGSSSSSCSGSVSGNLWIRRNSLDSDTWSVYLGDTHVKDVTFDFTNAYYKQKLYSHTSAYYKGHATSSAVGYINDVYLRGAGAVNIVNNTYNNSFNVTSEVVHNASTNITATYFTATDYTTSTDVITYYLSPDNGTTWEQVDNPSYHLFEAKGSNLRWRAIGSSTGTAGTGVNGVTIGISTNSPSNLTIDLGGDGYNEYSYNGVFNTSDNVSIILGGGHDNYISDNCAGEDHCLVPVTVSSDSSGGIIFSDLEYVTSATPFSLSNDLNNNSVITVNNSDGDNFTLSLDLRTFLKGDFNNFSIYVNDSYVDGSSDLRENSVDVRYSPFNVTSLTSYLEFYPSSNTVSNLEPYSQSSSSSFWTVTTESTNHTTKIYYNINSSLDSCMVLKASTTYSGVKNTITTSGQNLFNISGDSRLFGNYTNVYYNVSGVSTYHMGDIEFDGTYYYIATQTPKSIRVYYSNFTYIKSFDISSQTSTPFGIAIKTVGDIDYVYIGDMDNLRVYKYSFNKTSLSSFSYSSSFDISLNVVYTRGMDFDNDYLLIADDYFDVIARYNVTSGSYVDSISVSSESSSTTGVTFINNNYYVLNAADDNVYEYNSSGDYTSNHFSYGSETSVAYVLTNNNLYKFLVLGYIGTIDDKIYEYYDDTVNSSNGLWMWLDLNSCTRGSQIDSVFNSLCSDCVKTIDYDEWDGTYN